MNLLCEYKLTPHSRPFRHTIYLQRSDTTSEKSRRTGFTPDDRVMIDAQRWLKDNVSCPLKNMLSGTESLWAKYRDRNGNYHYRFRNKKEALLFKLAFHGKSIEFEVRPPHTRRWHFV